MKNENVFKHCYLEGCHVEGNLKCCVKLHKAETIGAS